MTPEEFMEWYLIIFVGICLAVRLWMWIDSRHD